MRRLLTFLLILLSAPLAAQEPSALYLTYTFDPTTSITIQWHTDKETPSTLTYKATTAPTPLPARGTALKIPRSRLYVHTLTLHNLKPDTTYTFTLDGSPTPHTFRTLPAKLTRPVRIVIGGDAYQKPPLFEQMNRTIASLDPDFIILGGDIAYTEGRSKFLHPQNASVHRWQAFFTLLTEQLIAPDGRIIPLVPLIGNHDIQKKKKRSRSSPLLFDFMAFPHKTLTYRPLDLGTYCSLLLLDTDHYHPIKGKQTLWLEAALHSRNHIPILIPIYHIAAYPSHYRYNGPTPTLLRNTWVPLFEKYPISAAFENHNHTYKRTHPLLHNHPHPHGILYLGDGAWGVKARTPKPNLPYIAHSAPLNHVWLLTLSQTPTLTSYTLEGHPYETLPLPKRISH